MAADTSRVHVLSYSSTNVSTTGYTVLIASTSETCARLQITDTSGKILKLAYGAAGSEVDFCGVPVSGTALVNYYIPPFTQISIKAIDANATTGYNILSLIPW